MASHVILAHGPPSHPYILLFTVICQSATRERRISSTLSMVFDCYEYHEASSNLSNDANSRPPMTIPDNSGIQTPPEHPWHMVVAT